MPVIEVNLEDFNRLVGKELSIEYLEERLPMLGCGWEGRTEEGFEIEVFPNRPDMLSIEGLARAFSSFIGLRTGLRTYEVRESEYRVRVEERVSSIRPYIVSAVVKGVSFSDDLIRSIIQMQEKLHITHCRKRRKASIGLHDLEPIEVLLKSEAVLITNREAQADPYRYELITRLRARIVSHLRARKTKYVMMNAPAEAAERIKAILPGMKSPTIVPLAEKGMIAIHTAVPEAFFWDVIEKLKKAGASDILVVPVEKMVV